MTRKEAIKKAIENFEWAIHADNRSDISLMDMQMAISALKEQPVVHGRWVDNIDESGKLCNAWRKCSACGGLNFSKRPPYCPNCGARMDGDSIDK